MAKKPVKEIKVNDQKYKSQKTIVSLWNSR